ncbi:tetratricopeptide repeat protein [Algoriphagus pacificus]|uniref:Tetratricopeptide repeat protein n=1 Tax=Algoriphagus pacificus TaxID=2811234 RepID=A0ABS3CE19_9BACT|nr:tetratricopeptide repeat protein [Algoriphagus pacificus]
MLVDELSDDWEVHFLKGQNLEKLEKYLEAQKFYEKSLELNPDQALVKKKLKDLANLVNTEN